MRMHCQHYQTKASTAIPAVRLRYAQESANARSGSSFARNTCRAPLAAAATTTATGQDEVGDPAAAGTDEEGGESGEATEDEEETDAEEEEMDVDEPADAAAAGLASGVSAAVAAAGDERGAESLPLLPLPPEPAASRQSAADERASACQARRDAVRSAPSGRAAAAAAARAAARTGSMAKSHSAPNWSADSCENTL
jgi:hypothetical protein